MTDAEVRPRPPPDGAASMPGSPLRCCILESPVRKVLNVAVALLVMVVILAIAIAVVAVVAMGMQGAGREKAPELANVMAETARHLNGDAEPPQGLVEFFEEIPSRRGSASSATSPGSATSPRSTTSPDSANSVESAAPAKSASSAS